MNQNIRLGGRKHFLCLNEEAALLNKQLTLVEQKGKSTVKGSIKCMRKGKNYYYAHQYRDSETKKYVCTYIKTAEVDLARQIAERDYYSHVKKLLLKKKEQLRLLDNEYDSAINDCYLSLDEGRKKLISPLIGTAEYQLTAWKNEKYDMNLSYPEGLTRQTDRGERVRSKSEELIANYLYRLRDFVDYKYERPLTLMVNGKEEIIYPDFTIINLRTGEIFILEHVSRLDIQSYHDSFVWKHNAYIENGLIQNGTVLYSFESVNNQLNMGAVKKMIKDIILK